MPTEPQERPPAVLGWRWLPIILSQSAAAIPEPTARSDPTNVRMWPLL